MTVSIGLKDDVLERLSSVDCLLRLLVGVILLGVEWTVWMGLKDWKRSPRISSPEAAWSGRGLGREL